MTVKLDEKIFPLISWCDYIEYYLGYWALMVPIDSWTKYIFLLYA